MNGRLVIGFLPMVTVSPVSGATAGTVIGTDWVLYSGASGCVWDCLSTGWARTAVSASVSWRSASASSQTAALCRQAT